MGILRLPCFFVDTIHKYIYNRKQKICSICICFLQKMKWEV